MTTSAIQQDSTLINKTINNQRAKIVITEQMQKTLEFKFKNGRLRQSVVDYNYVRTIAEWELILKDTRNKLLPDFGPICFESSMTWEEFKSDLEYSIDRLYTDNNNQFEIQFLFAVSYRHAENFVRFYEFDR